MTLEGAREHGVPTRTAGDRRLYYGTWLSAAAFVTLRIVESQTAALVKSDDERGRQIIGILTQIATVQAQLASVSQQQSAVGQEMHERIMAVERRSNGEPERYPRARP